MAGAATSVVVAAAHRRSPIAFGARDRRDHRLSARLDRPHHHGLQRRAAGLSRHPAGAGGHDRGRRQQIRHRAGARLAYIPSVVRVVRGTVLSIREKEYIEASRVIGNSELYTMLRHVLPNCRRAGRRAGHQHVRLGAAGRERAQLPRPRRAAAGADLGQHAGGEPALHGERRLAGIAPGICIALTLLGINLLGDALRDRLDPRMVRHG